MVSIIIVRHGQSEHHLNGMTGGWTDTPLTELGRRQAACLAERLRRDLEGIECRVLSSDLQRAAQTAEPIAQALRSSLVFEPDLREFNNGAAAGLTYTAADALRLPRTSPEADWRPYPGAETWREFFARTGACLDRLSTAADRPLVLVSHGGTIKNCITWWLGLSIDHRATIAFSIPPASITTLGIDHRGRHWLERLSDTAHLYAAGLGGSLDSLFAP